MSYILDALKKSESERAHGAVPGIHSQPVFSGSDHTRTALRGQGWIWIVLAVTAIAVAVFLWFRPEPKLSDPAPALRQLPTRVQAIEHSEAPAGRPDGQTATPQLAGGHPSPAASSVPASRAVQPEPRGVPESESRPLAKNTVRPIAKPLVEPLPARKPDELDTAPGDNRVGTLRELPENIQREVPAVVFSGYIYSNNAADRSVLVSNRLLREGDLIAPGLTLEKMLPKEAILNYLGHRYRAPY